MMTVKELRNMPNYKADVLVILVFYPLACKGRIRAGSRQGTVRKSHHGILIAFHPAAVEYSPILQSPFI
jgi:hypothetical protein